jgi:hypothetical protein
MSDLFTATNRRETKIPLDMLETLPIGYYAVQQDTSKPMTFMRCSRDWNKKHMGWMKIQTQHGEELMPALTMAPVHQLYWYNMSIEMDLLLACVDPVQAAVRYGQEIGRCCRCNKELTDERSRWYSIGPECEQHWPKVILTIDETKGVFGE